ncbi:DUF2188 domain-containing protein [Georgenia sp. AZ-5]|uniref:DUF2188 domain-containing protein n=1 Tax=Georgenia sp. AZ-5 TaxID=3367526 RepID=UPI0037544632
MPRGDVETYHQDGHWMNRHEGTGEEAFGISRTKAEAVAAGRGVARREKVEHISKDLHGRISARTSYGHDPRNIRG